MLHLLRCRIERNLSYLQKMQKKLSEVQEALTEKEYEGEAGGGLVKAIVSGNHEGEWVRGSVGHHWADFDTGQSEEDVADSAIHLDPYIESSRTVFYAHQTDISNDMDGGAPLAQIIYFHIKPGHEQVFRGAVTKIHEALAEQESWPAYNWYTVADGGKQPTWLVVLERENWAAFEPGDPEFGAVMAAKFGEEETGKIFEQLFSVVTGQYSHTIAFPPELSYTPGAE